MADIETVAWVRPAEPIRGLDHLGVQAPCIALYGQLLPGITNVTDRARYYSFHPWIIWSFDKRYKDHSLEEFQRVLRRAECLFALIAIRHARRLGDDEALHGKAMVGRDKLLRIQDSASEIVLDEYAALDGLKRYFKNKLGGLGQYYFGPLRDLRVLDHSPQGTGYPPGYDRERGRALAEAFSVGVPEDEFFRALEASSLVWEDLDELTEFCPCRLCSNAMEHELLLDLFMARSETYQHDSGLTRRASLGLILDLAGQRHGIQPTLSRQCFEVQLTPVPSWTDPTGRSPRCSSVLSEDGEPTSVTSFSPWQSRDFSLPYYALLNAITMAV